MQHFVIWIKEQHDDSSLKEMIAVAIFEKYENIGYFLDDICYRTRYELRVLDDVSEFNVELNIYTDVDFEEPLSLEIFAERFSVNNEVDVLIPSFNDDDPYEWILFSKNSQRIVDEILGDNIGVNINQFGARL